MCQSQYADVVSMQQETPNDARVQRNESQVIMDAVAFQGYVQRQASGGRDPITVHKTVQSG